MQKMQEFNSARPVERGGASKEGTAGQDRRQSRPFARRWRSRFQDRLCMQSLNFQGQTVPARRKDHRQLPPLLPDHAHHLHGPQIIQSHRQGPAGEGRQRAAEQRHMQAHEALIQMVPIRLLREVLQLR